MASGAVGGAGGAPQPSNWLTEWQARTPVVSQYAVYLMLPVTLAGMIFPGLGAALSNGPAALTGGQLWRLVTCLPYQGGLLTLLVVLLMTLTQAPQLEARVGSLRFLVSSLVMAGLVNVSFDAISVRTCATTRTRARGRDRPAGTGVDG